MRLPLDLLRLTILPLPLRELLGTLWLLLLAPGWIAWALISLWFLYRIIKGMVRMSAGQSMDPANAF